MQIGNKLEYDPVQDDEQYSRSIVNFCVFKFLPGGKRESRNTVTRVECLMMLNFILFPKKLFKKLFGKSFIHSYKR